MFTLKIYNENFYKSPIFSHLQRILALSSLVLRLKRIVLIMSNAAYHGGKEDVFYAKEDNKRISSLFTAQVAFMTAMAQFPFKLERWFPKSLAWMGWLLARIYCAFWILLAAQMAFCFAITTYDKLYNGQLEEITDSLTMVIIYSFSCFGCCYWLRLSSQLERLLERINQEHRHHSLAGEMRTYFA